MYDNNPICWCKDGYKIDSYTKLCVKDQTGEYQINPHYTLFFYCC